LEISAPIDEKMAMIIHRRDIVSDFLIVAIIRLIRPYKAITHNAAHNDDIEEDNHTCVYHLIVQLS
jgi:hypothetical protein